MKRVSDMGRKWNAKVPRSAIARYVNTLHVGTPSTELEKTIRAACSGPGYTKQITDQSVAYALLVHAQNGALYRRVTGSL